MAVRCPDLGPDPLPPFTRRDLQRLGLSRHELDALLLAGLVVQPVRGAYMDARRADDLAARVQAVALVLPPGAVLARRTAAWLHGIDPRGPGELEGVLPVECLVPAGATVPRRQGLVAREAALPPSDIVVVEGVPVTTADRTVIDLARYLKPFMGLAILDAFARDKLVAIGDVRERIEDFKGERGIAQARRLASLCDAAAESFGESWLRLRLLDAGFPRPELQIWIADRDGVGVYRLDLGWPDRKIAVEYDGVEFHSRPDDVRRDALRREHLAREWGWHTVGVGRGEVLGRSLALELGVGELLGMEPKIRNRLW